MLKNILIYGANLKEILKKGSVSVAQPKLRSINENSRAGPLCEIKCSLAGLSKTFQASIRLSLLDSINIFPMKDNAANARKQLIAFHLFAAKLLLRPCEPTNYCFPGLLSNDFAINSL